MLCSITSQDRSELIHNSLKAANEQLKEFYLEVAFLSQWPPKKPAESTVFDERPDVELRMKVHDQWHPIDIIYIRQMLQAPEKLKTREELTRDIFR